MENPENSDNNSQFLVPEMIRRSKASDKMIKRGRGQQEHAEKVYLSKKKCLTNLRSSIDEIKETIDSLEQKSFSRHEARAALLRGRLQSLETTKSRIEDKLNSLEQEELEAVCMFEQQIGAIAASLAAAFQNHAGRSIEKTYLDALAELEREKAINAKMNKRMALYCNGGPYDINAPYWAEQRRATANLNSVIRSMEEDEARFEAEGLGDSQQLESRILQLEAELAQLTAAKQVQEQFY